MTYTNPPFVERASDVFSVRHRKAPRTWGSAFGGGVTYPSQDHIYKPSFLELSEGNKKRSWRLRFLIEFELFWF